MACERRAGRSQALTIQADSGAASKQARSAPSGPGMPGRSESRRQAARVRATDGRSDFRPPPDLRVSTRPRRARHPRGKGFGGDSRERLPGDLQVRFGPAHPTAGAADQYGAANRRPEPAGRRLCSGCCAPGIHVHIILLSHNVKLAILRELDHGAGRYRSLVRLRHFPFADDHLRSRSSPRRAPALGGKQPIRQPTTLAHS